MYKRGMGVFFSDEARNGNGPILLSRSIYIDIPFRETWGRSANAWPDVPAHRQEHPVGHVRLCLVLAVPCLAMENN